MWENQGGRFGLRLRRLSCAKPHHIPSDIPDHLPTGRVDRRDKWTLVSDGVDGLSLEVHDLSPRLSNE
jgi:hypothetical protein